MTDYIKTTGTTGKMMIRDLGSVIEFWFKAGYENDWWNNMDFSVTALGVTTNHEIDYPTGADWKKVAQRTVNSSTLVTFRLLETTGTQGMGGPTTFSVSISRGSVPDAPTKVQLSGITFTSMVAKFWAGDSNGYPMDQHQLAWSTVNTTASGLSLAYSSGTTTVTGLTPGTRYYFWARSHNAKGWGPWSPVSYANTLAGVWVKVGFVWRKAIPYVKVAGVWRMAQPYAKRAGVWKSTL